MNTRRFEPTGDTLAAAISGSAAKFPAHGFTFQDMTGAERFWSFIDIDRETAARGRALQDLGLSKGDRVGLIVIEPQDFVLTFLSAARVGIVPVPLYPPMSMAELDAYVDRMARILQTSRASLLVASESLQNVLWQAVDRVESVKKLVPVERLHADGAPTYPEITEDDLCFLQYTSGSTSDPKGVAVTHRSLRSNVVAIMNHYQLDPETTKSLAWLPLYHDMGLIGFVMSTVFWGKRCVLIPTLRFLKRPNVWLDAVHTHRATITFCPPFALPLAARRAGEEQLSKWDLSCLATVGVGAEPIHAEGCRQFTELFASRCGLPTTAVSPAYGMAEATLAMSLNPFGAPLRTLVVDAEAFQQRGRVEPPASEESAVFEHVSCGVTFPEHDVRVASPETGAWLPEGSEGELCFSGPSVTPGYFENAEATAACFVDGWLHTGDLGYLWEGEVYVTGRLKDLIILNGRNLHPQALEWTVQELDGVRRGNVIAFSVPGDGTELVIVALERRADVTGDGIADAVRERLSAELGVPVAEVVVLAPGLLPKTSSGKLQRRKARQLYLAGELGAHGPRTQGSSASSLTLAKHVARSMWARAKNTIR
ncbi:MAG: fatty acyl-AMP ligase [Myxococcales bacterium]|nr:fatty acyl-AMP ligase [Myxococcales bacterium]MCB9530926.1 fatty acyl-AMP ligase [Myxococcales bacterium]MCB9534528.1 fatty acyl-AMP ligase [Myxococcales bacterium]